MKNCSKWRDMLILDYYGELTSRKARRLARHLEHCPECRQAAERLSSQMGKIRTPRDDAPDEAFWAGFMSRLDQRIDGMEPSAKPAMRLLEHPRKWALAAAAMVLLILGGVAGHLLFPPGTPRPAAGINANSGFSGELGSHLDTIHPLMVDCSVSPPAEFAQSMTFSKPRIRNLLLRNRLLMRRAQEKNDAAALEMLGEIEMILLELSVPTRMDADRCGQVHDLVNRSDLVGRMDILRRRAVSPGGREARI